MPLSMQAKLLRERKGDIAWFMQHFDEGQDVEAEAPASRPLAEYLMDCERDYLRMVLEHHDGHMAHSAEALGITRKTLWEKMRRLGMSDSS